MDGRLAGKVALITGTGGGQGRAAALAFANEGAIVVGGDLKEKGAAETVEMIERAGGKATSRHPIDFADSTAVTDWIDSAAEEFDGFDILYNNASAPHFASVTEMTDAEWSATLRNELDLVFYACRAAWPHLVERGGGAIVNVGSITGIASVRPAAGGFAHAATKHGVIGLTRELANEGGPVGIRVNAISPGLIVTPATQELVETPGFVNEFLDHQIIRRTGRPEDIAAAAVFLSSEESSFITGENLVVDGGYTVV